MFRYTLLKQALTVLAGKFARARLGGLTRIAIRRFVARYGVNMQEAAKPEIASFASFNDFFTRSLRKDVRPLSDADYLCPVDGSISQFGAIKQDSIFQAKGHSYSTTALLGGDAQLAAQFEDGSFATLYLSPRDYHRIHMPCSGRLRRMIYVPGTLYSVNPAAASRIPGLFARNERVVCVFDSESVPFVLTLVGATIVGSMATVWHGVVNPPRTSNIREWRYDEQKIELGKGEEMGRFQLGSTVVILFPKNTLTFNPEWVPARAIRMGEMMGIKP